jgi:hypothetical protein
MRKRGTESTDNPREVSPALEPPSEAWLLRTLAELRREQRYPSVAVPRKQKKGKVGS